MASLPTPGGSDGTYGTELNAFLEIEHDADGTHGAITPTSVASVGTTTVGTFFGLGASTQITISSGVVTATKSHHSVDTESDDATDDLDTINGGSSGDLLQISANNAARTVVATDGTGNLVLAGNFSMDNTSDTLLLIKEGGSWVELSRSNNGA